MTEQEVTLRARAFPDADRRGGRYWQTEPVPMYTGICTNCKHNLLEGGEFAGWGDLCGVQSDVDEMWSCPECDWPLCENQEQCLREEAEERGMTLPYGNSLKTVHEFVRLSRESVRANA